MLSKRLIGTFLLSIFLGSLTTVGNTTEPVIANGPVDQATISSEQVLRWSSETLINLLTFDYKNITQAIQNSHSYFTEQGFQAYQTVLQKNSWIQTLQRKKYDVLPVLDDPAVLIKEGLEQGVYSWTIQVPLMLHFRGPFDMTKQRTTIEIAVKRSPLAEFTNGLAIDNFTMESK